MEATCGGSRRSRLLVHWYESSAACGCVGRTPQCPCDGRIGLLDLEGNVQLLPRIGLDDGGADWSPDGRRIVFTSFRSAGAGQPARGQIMVMNADGSGVRALTTGTLDEWSPGWSRSTDRIYFIRAMSIYSTRSDGGDVRRLTATGYSDVIVHSR
jgi:hypothetical protein